jgi:hypothetical protein
MDKKPNQLENNVFEALRKNPGLTSKQISELIGVPITHSSSALTTMYYKGAVDRVDLKLRGNIPVYSYTINDPFKPARDRIVNRRIKPKTEGEGKGEGEGALSKLSKKYSAQKDEVTEVPPEVPEVPPEVPEVPPEAPEVYGVEISDFERLLVQLASQIADQLVDRVFSNIAHRLPEAFLAELSPSGNQPVLLKTVLPKIAIVGLLPEQVVMMRNEFEGKINLTFPAKDCSKELKSAAYFNEKVITMTKFIGHHTEHTLKSAGAKLLRIAGGMTDLRLHLTVIVNKSQAT